MKKMLVLLAMVFLGACNNGGGGGSAPLKSNDLYNQFIGEKLYVFAGVEGFIEQVYLRLNEDGTSDFKTETDTIHPNWKFKSSHFELTKNGQSVSCKYQDLNYQQEQYACLECSGGGSVALFCLTE